MNSSAHIRSALAVLAAAILFSALGAVLAKHESRKRFIHLQELIETRDTLNIDWGRLQIEQSTWSTHGRVERLAREQLDMTIPGHEDIMMVRQ